MKRLIAILVSAVAVLVCAQAIHAQDLLVPAGTLLQCTMDEPNFSSATAAIGDPVLCHLKTLSEFGKPVFPRGSMLGGHLEADKEPGHFVGKGYLKITFDRVILPNGDLPVPAKVIQARGYKIDKEGDIKGKGHATRDVVEWMIPPLWPWKVITLPARGPRPALKGEEPLELRLMDDIVIAQAKHPERPPYASSFHPSATSTSPAAAPQGTPQPSAGAMQLLVEKHVDGPAATGTQPEANESAVNTPQASERFTILVLKSNQEIEVAKYKRDGDLLMFQDTQGRKGSVDVGDVDWRQTTEMTEQVRSVDSGIAALPVN
ncbi:MAG TPA: hypothetical protein VMJ35_16385 [Dongiaceae bacterium]|nr:hypothetical protein [Dongiaceae bacterium]